MGKRQKDEERIKRMRKRQKDNEGIIGLGRDKRIRKRQRNKEKAKG